MNLNIDMGAIVCTEFGVGRNFNGGQEYVALIIDRNVQVMVKSMVIETINELNNIERVLIEQHRYPPQYEPSEKYGPNEYLQLSLNSDLVDSLKVLHEATNLPTNMGAINNHSGIFCYFVRLTDSNGKRITALRRASQFKAVLKSRLIRVTTDALKAIPDKVFKLDNDFDILIDDAQVHILRPKSFEFVCKLTDSVLAAVPTNIEKIKGNLDYIDFTNIQEYAIKHARAARCIASIISNGMAEGVDIESLKKACIANSIVFEINIDNKFVINEAQIPDLLDVLERRRYTAELVPGRNEHYRAESRHRV